MKRRRRRRRKQKNTDDEEEIKWLNLWYDGNTGKDIRELQKSEYKQTGTGLYEEATSFTYTWVRV